MKLSIKGTKQEYSDRVLRALWHVLKENDQDNRENCINMTIQEVVESYEEIGEFYSGNSQSEHQLGLIALHALGTNLPDRIEEIRTLRIIGDGLCENCGSDVCTEDNYSRTCLTCNHVQDKDYAKDEDEN